MDPLPEPMLPTPGRLPIGHQGWKFEVKFDGIRVLADVHGGQWRLLTRQGNDVTRKFPELGQITDLGDVLLDGELVVVDDRNRLDFKAAMRRLLATSAKSAALADALPASVFTFDVLRLDGTDLRNEPYSQRRAILEGLDLPAPWAVPPVFDDGAATVAASLELGMEGVVAKRLDSPYVAGRSRFWVKSRHRSVLDLTVIGWARRGSGEVTLLLAEPTAEGLRYCGGCTAPGNLIEMLAPLEAAEPPIAVPAWSRKVHWVRPELQVEVRAASREPDGRLRHPRFERARPDQPPTA